MPNPGGNIACVEKAYAGPFSRDEAIQLCRGSFGTAPADCAIKIYAEPFSKLEAIEICRSDIAHNARVVSGALYCFL